jgi:hypothetical protein
LAQTLKKGLFAEIEILVIDPQPKPKTQSQ